MKKKYKNLFKNIGLFTIGSFGSKIISFLLLPLYTSILSPEAYGTIDLIQTTVMLLTPILLLSIQDATLRFGMDNNYNKKDVLLTSTKIIFKGSIVLFLGLTFIYIFDFMEISIEYLIFMFVLFAFGALNNCFNLYLKSKNKVSVIAIGGIINTIITCLSNVLLLVIIKLGINGYMISLAIGTIIQTIYQFIAGKVYKDLYIKGYNDLSKEMISYSTPLIANSIAWWINNASDRYILTFISGVAINGVYAISYKIPNVLTMFQNIFYDAWSISAISEYDAEDKDGFIGNNIMIYSFASFIGCSFLLLININIAKILYAKEYFEAWKCVPFLLTATVFNGIAQLEGSLFAATKKTKKVAITTSIGALVNIICNFIFIYLFGAVGAAVSTMLGYSVTWLLRTILLNEFIKVKVDWKIYIMSMTILIFQTFLATFNILLITQIICFILIVFLTMSYFGRRKDALIHIKNNIK